MNGMIAQIQSIPELIRSVTRPYDEAVRAALSSGLVQSSGRIYLVGCGDSNHASIGAELAFEHLTGLPTEALTSMQFGRYAAETLPGPGPASNLVVGISVSGEVARTVEAVLTARKCGATTLGLTATPGSRMARAAERIIDTSAPPFADPPGIFIPGVRSYVANQVCLLLLALRIGELRGRLGADEAEGLRHEIEGLADAAEWTIAANDGPARRLAEDWRDAREFVFAGAGPNYGAAIFCAAKVLEASGDPAIGQDTEEWAHLQYFAREAGTPTFLIGTAGNDLSRMAEVALAAHTIGRRLAAVVPASARAIADHADRVLPLPEELREMFSMAITTIPGSLFAAYRADVIGEPFFRNLTGGRAATDGGGINRNRSSEILNADMLRDQA